MINKEQALLAKIMDLFARKFDKNAILRGGMVLRGLGMMFRAAMTRLQ